MVVVVAGGADGCGRCDPDAGEGTEDPRDYISQLSPDSLEAHLGGRHVLL